MNILETCADIKLDLYLIYDIYEKDIFKYNSSSDYYNDICYTYTTENGTDIILSDRRNEFIDNNMSLCEEYCEYKGYDTNTKSAKCECQTKTIFTDNKNQKNKQKIMEEFLNIKDMINFGIMKCYKQLFKTESIKKNIGNYILLFILNSSSLQINNL